MNYYDEIKKELINNEITKKVKDYSKNKSDLSAYFNVGKLLTEAGKHYGEGIIKEYSIKLTNELGKGYTQTNLKLIRQFYIFSKSHIVCDQLSWSHYRKLLTVKDNNKIMYFINISITQNLSVRQLLYKIKNKEYERLNYKTKLKLTSNEKINIEDFVKNPIIIKNTYNYNDISEKILKKLILEDIDNFLYRRYQ